MPGWAGKGVGPPETVLVEVTVVRMVFVTETVTGTVTRDVVVTVVGIVVVTVVGTVVEIVVGTVTRTVAGTVTGAVTETVTGTVTETFEVAVLTTETVTGTVMETVAGTVTEIVLVGPGLATLTEELRHPSVVARQNDWFTGRLPQGAATDGFCKKSVSSFSKPRRETAHPSHKIDRRHAKYIFDSLACPRPRLLVVKPPSTRSRCVWVKRILGDCVSLTPPRRGLVEEAEPDDGRNDGHFAATHYRARSGKDSR